MPEPRPRVTLEIFTPAGQEQIFYLGPHAPRLTPKEIDLLHKVWLQLSERMPGQEIHHHDIVHFALTKWNAKSRARRKAPLSSACAITSKKSRAGVSIRKGSIGTAGQSRFVTRFI